MKKIFLFIQLIILMYPLLSCNNKSNSEYKSIADGGKDKSNFFAKLSGDDDVVPVNESISGYYYNGQVYINGFFKFNTYTASDANRTTSYEQPWNPGSLGALRCSPSPMPVGTHKSANDDLHFKIFDPNDGCMLFNSLLATSNSQPSTEGLYSFGIILPINEVLATTNNIQFPNTTYSQFEGNGRSYNLQDDTMKNFKLELGKSYIFKITAQIRRTAGIINGQTTTDLAEQERESSTFALTDPSITISGPSDLSDFSYGIPPGYQAKWTADANVGGEINPDGFTIKWYFRKNDNPTLLYGGTGNELFITASSSDQRYEIKAELWNNINVKVAEIWTWACRNSDCPPILPQ